MSKLFNNEKIKDQIEKNKNTEIEFRIGVSKINPKQLSYCLVREIDKKKVEIFH